MNKQQHTPGPWVVGPGYSEDGFREVPVGHPTALGTITTAVAIDTAGLGSQDANARLVAAAPELLAAARAVNDFINGVADAVEPFALVRAAIAKATGTAEQVAA